MTLIDRGDCPMRHENGNCTVAGGFCTAVNDPICEALHNAYNCGQRSVDPIHEAGGCCCRECEDFLMENLAKCTTKPFSELDFLKARANREFVILHCRTYNKTRGPADFCSYGIRKDAAE